MSILIKNFDMPKSCSDCRFSEWNGFSFWCIANGGSVIKHPLSEDYKYENCPLIEVPTPHGRLIDSNELKDLIVEEFDGVCTYDVSPDEVVSDFQNIVDKCKTIIKMEE